MEYLPITAKQVPDIWELAVAFNKALHDCEDHQRVDLMDKATEGFCEGCGEFTADLPVSCQCDNDE